MMDGGVEVFVTLEMADQSVRRVTAVIPAPTPLLLLLLVVVLLFKTEDFIVVVFVIDDSVAADDTVTGLLLLIEDLFAFLDDLLVTEIPLPLLMMEVVLLS